MDEKIETKSFKELNVWKKSHNIVLAIYRKIKDFPKEEKYGITSQMRRSAISVPANIAEGYRKKSKSEKIHFFEISLCSLQELQYYIYLCKDLQLINDDFYDKLNFDLDEVGKMLTSYIKAIDDSRIKKEKIQ